MRTVIGVMGPDTVTEKVTEAAYELGKGIAEAGHVLLTGGRSKGVMDAACRGAKAAGGLTIGVLPTGDLSQASEAVDIPIITGMGSGRNNINGRWVPGCRGLCGLARDVGLSVACGTMRDPGPPSLGGSVVVTPVSCLNGR